MTCTCIFLNRVIVIAALWIALSGAALAASSPAQAPIIRTELSPRVAMVGQTVTLRVDVLVPTWFTAPIDFPPAINVAGVTGQLSNSAAVNLNEQINNQGYAGMSKLYTVVAQQAGEFKLPALPIKISYSADGGSRAMTLQTTPQTFRAMLPAGAEDLGYFFATPNYSLKQSVDRSLNRLKVGDAIVRRIAQRAEGVAAMTLPGLAFAELEGVSVYPAEAQLNDSGGERGSVRIGERIDTVTYVLRKPGALELPGLKIGWFDTANRKMRWTSVPTLRFDVAPDPNALPSNPLPPADVSAVLPAPTGGMKLRTLFWRWWRSPAMLPGLGALVGLILLGLLLKRRGIRPLEVWRTWRQRRSDSETAHFKRCLAVLRNANPVDALNATVRWLNHISPNGRGASLAKFAEEFGDNEFRRAVKQQTEDLFAPSRPSLAWDVAGYRHSLIGARKRWLRTKQRTLRQTNSLTTLNPVYD